MLQTLSTTDLHTTDDLNVVSNPPHGTQPSALVVIDPTVEAPDFLANGVHSQASVLVLDRDRNSIQQITEALTVTPAQSLHIVSHGAPGRLYLGNAVLTDDTLTNYRSQLAQWGVSEILLYACNLAGDAAQAEDSPFLTQLHRWTGARIAASAERVGSAAQGGRWQLSHRIGQIVSDLAFTPATQQAYAGVFSAVSAPSFNPAVPFTVGNNPYDIEVADFNGDGFLDLVTSGEYNSAVSVLLGNGEGDFSSAINTSAISGFTYDTTVGDFNGDGYDDVAVAVEGYPGSVSVLLWNPYTKSLGVDQGPFPIDGYDPEGITAGDFNGDGNLDLVTANESSYDGGVSVLIGSGNGTFGSYTIPTGDVVANAVILADFNGDGLLDIATVDAYTDSSTSVSVLLRNSTGGFSSPILSPVGEGAYDLAAGDINGDGNIDLVTAGYYSGTVSVLLGNGDGTFGAATELTVGGSLSGIELADIDRDRNLDVVTSNDSTNSVSVLLGNGDGTFDAATNFSVGLSPSSLVVDDFNADGALDIATANEGETTVSLLLNLTPLTAAGIFTFDQLTEYVELSTGFSIPFTPVEIGGLSIELLYDETYYLNQNPDVAAAVLNGAVSSGYEHFLSFGQFEGRDPSSLYDEDFYLASNPDVAAAVASGTSFRSGFEHYVTFGQFEGRSPSDLFDEQAYLAANPDVADAVISGGFSSGFDHYLEFGINEGRGPEILLFDEAFYLAANPDVAAAVASGTSFSSGFEHYVTFGQIEGRDPSSIFDESSYLALNSDVAAAVASGTSFRSGFEHYITFGRGEDRLVFS